MARRVERYGEFMKYIDRGKKGEGRGRKNCTAYVVCDKENVCRNFGIVVRKARCSNIPCCARPGSAQKNGAEIKIALQACEMVGICT